MDPAAARYPAVPQPRGHYESVYLQAADAAARTAVWLRCTVHKRPGERPVGSVWATLFADDGPRAAKATLPPEALAPGARGGPAGGAATIDRDGARGAIEDLAEWELRFEPAPAPSPPAAAPAPSPPAGAPAPRAAAPAQGAAAAAPAPPAAAPAAAGDAGAAAAAPAAAGDAAPFPYLPRRWMYAAPLPRTKAVCLLPAIRVAGRVRVRDRTATVDGWPGMVGHNWGAEHAERWVWLRAAGFPDRPGTWLDAIVGRVRVGGRTTPWIANGCLALDGVRHRLGGPGLIRATRVDARPDRCAVVLPGRGLTVRGVVDAPRARTVGWRYRDPAGSERHVAHCGIADLTLEVARPGAPPLRLALAGGAAYELGMRERDHGVPLQPYDDP